MRPLPKLLSKTKLMRGYRCTKALYLTIQNPELEPPVTPEMQALFDQGNRIGELARTYYPGGELVDFPAWEFGNSLKRTRELIQAGKELIYEAAFEYKGCYARADIIRYSRETQRWTILEAKSSTKVKDEHLDDVGLQAWIIANSGVQIEKICILHLNPECRFPDLKNLFVETDVTTQLREKYPLTTPRLNEIFNALRQPKPPDVDIGPHCHSGGRDCEFVNHCYAAKALPEISVLDIYVLKTAWDLYRQGTIELKDLDTSEFTEIQKRMVRAHLENKRIVETEALQAAVAEWKFPLVFLDFETLGDAVPRFRGAGPYTDIPFQFSVHTLTSVDAEPVHFEFLHDAADDPREPLIRALVQACGEEGSIIAYNAKFEIKVITRLAQDFPAFEASLLALIPRFQDPLPIIRETVYDPAFKGGFGLKAVAPALLAGKFQYDHLNVPDGKAAQRAYAEMTASSTSATRREELRLSLLEYCGQDTMACVELVRWMMKPVV